MRRAPAPWMRRRTACKRRTAWGGQRTAKRQKCARTARTPGVGAHAGLRDRLCLASGARAVARATFARNEQTNEVRPGCQTFAAERCKLLLITSTQISSIHPQYGPSLRTRIVIISRHVRSRGVDELKMLLLMPQKFNIPTLKIRCLLETFG